MLNPKQLQKTVPINKHKLKDIQNLLNKHSGEEWQNILELHKKFKAENNIQVSYSFFCKHRPFWIFFSETTQQRHLFMHNSHKHGAVD